MLLALEFTLDTLGLINLFYYFILGFLSSIDVTNQLELFLIYKFVLDSVG